MVRVRLALLAASVALLLLVGALAWRAQQGLLAERALRHRAVAERAFEEMERALGDWLEREEARPPEGFAAAPREPGEPFVLGAFDVDAAGVLRTTPAAAGADERLRRVVGGLWSHEPDFARGDAAAPEEAVAKASAQAPGTTRALAGPGVGDARPEARADALAKGESSSAYDVLQSLNRSAQERSERKQKQVLALAPSGASLRERRAAGDAPSDAVESEGSAGLRGLGYLEDESEPRAGSASAEPARAPSPPAEADARAEGARPAEVARASTAPSAAAPRAPVAPERAAVRVTLDPMLGVAVGSDSLVLYRTVLAQGRAQRQGLVLDRARLGGWLSERVIAGSALADVAALRFDGETSAPPPAGIQYLFAHRFAEPFDALHAELGLAALPGAGSPRALAALVAVLLLVGAAGLFAVHRTASVVVQYAERRSHFAAAVSHELKTPLTAIRMYAEMLRDDLVPGEAKRREYYRTLTDESERLSRLVDNVLEFSKLEGGRRELRLVRGDVAPLVREAAEKLSAHAAREGFALEVDCEPELPAARFDRDALLQVLFNLLDNALKYAGGAEDKRVRLAARAEGGRVCLAVRDFGPGVAREPLARVFEPFYRAENELTRSAKGTGIGLALVKELGERMGAEVRATNADGGGFQVELRFPKANGS